GRSPRDRQAGLDLPPRLRLSLETAVGVGREARLHALRRPRGQSGHRRLDPFGQRQVHLQPGGGGPRLLERRFRPLSLPARSLRRGRQPRPRPQRAARDPLRPRADLQLRFGLHRHAGPRLRPGAAGAPGLLLKPASRMFSPRGRRGLGGFARASLSAIMRTARIPRLFGVLAAALAVAPLVPILSIVSVGQPAQAVAPARPNILFILTDDQRWDSLGVAGNPIVKTPILDRLARKGVLFTNNFGTTPVCYASRASIYTGQYNRRHGIDSFEDSFTPEALAQTYPLLLRQAGYFTGFVGKWGIGGDLPEQDFDVWNGFAGQGSYFEEGIPEHLTRRQGHQAAAFIRTAPEPFQLTVAFKAPHVQDGGCSCTMPPDPADLHLYDDVTIPKPHTATDAAFADLPRFLRESEGRFRWFDQFGNPQLDQKSR